MLDSVLVAEAVAVAIGVGSWQRQLAGKTGGRMQEAGKEQ